MSRSPESWSEEKREVVEAVLAGRLARREVVGALGIAASTLKEWIRAERRRKAKRRGVGGFVAVDVRRDGGPAQSCGVVEIPGGMRVRVEPGFDAEEVVRLVRAIAFAC